MASTVTKYTLRMCIIRYYYHSFACYLYHQRNARNMRRRRTTTLQTVQRANSVTWCVLRLIFHMLEFFFSHGKQFVVVLFCANTTLSTDPSFTVTLAGDRFVIRHRSEALKTGRRVTLAHQSVAESSRECVRSVSRSMVCMKIEKSPHLMCASACNRV